MSAVCIFDFTKSKLEYSQLNDLLKTLTEAALTKDMAILYRYRGYADDIVQSADLKQYFILSNSFVYPDCGFLEPEEYTKTTSGKFNFSAFSAKFGVLQELLDILFRFHVQVVEIYTTIDGSVNSENDFEEISCTKSSFLDCLFKNVESHAPEYAYGFPTSKFIIREQ